MKLHTDPAATGSRAVLLYCEENSIPMDVVEVSLAKGEHRQPAFLAVNPNGLVPVLVDGDFVLTQTAAILMYVADKHDALWFSRDAAQRARIVEVMQWFTSDLERDWIYNLTYPQVFAHHRRSQDAQAGTLAWGLEKSRHWLNVLDRHILGDRAFLCGESISIADCLGSAVITTGSLIGTDVSQYPSIDRWMKRMRERPTWNHVNERFNTLAAMFRGNSFVAVR